MSEQTEFYIFVAVGCLLAFLGAVGVTTLGKRFPLPVFLAWMLGLAVYLLLILYRIGLLPFVSNQP